MGFVNPISLKGPAEITHGWMLVGLALNILLMGVMIAQVYMYYTQYRDDTWWLKAMVAAVFLLDIINTAFLFTYIYRSLITFFGDVQFLAQVDWTLATGAWTTGVIAAIVQLFFAWRIFVLTRNWVYVVVIGSLALAGCGASIAVPVKTGLSFPVSRIHEVKPAVTVWLASDVAADIIITTVLVWYLVSQVLHKHKSGFKRSDMVVDRIIRFTLQTGLLTVVFASIDLFFFLFDPTGTHFLFNFPLSKLYSNSLMSSLNSRRGWKFGGTSSGVVSDSDGPITTSWVQRHIPPTVKKTQDVAATTDSQELREVHIHTPEQFDEQSRTLHTQSSGRRSMDTDNWAANINRWSR